MQFQFTLLFTPSSLSLSLLTLFALPLQCRLELKSRNTELTTANRQLQQKVEQLRKSDGAANSLQVCGVGIGLPRLFLSCAVWLNQASGIFFAHHALLPVVSRLLSSFRLFDFWFSLRLG